MGARFINFAPIYRSELDDDWFFELGIDLNWNPPIETTRESMPILANSRQGGVGWRYKDKVFSNLERLRIWNLLQIWQTSNIRVVLTSSKKKIETKLCTNFTFVESDRFRDWKRKLSICSFESNLQDFSSPFRVPLLSSLLRPELIRVGAREERIFEPVSALEREREKERERDRDRSS